MSDTGTDQQNPENTEAGLVAEPQAVAEPEPAAGVEPAAEIESAVAPEPGREDGPTPEGEPTGEILARSELPASDEPAGTRRGASRTRRAVPVVLAVLVLAGAVVVGLLGWRALDELRAQGDREAALDAARTGTAAVLSYSSKTLDADLARAHAAIGGAFVAKFDAITNSSIVPAARQRDLASKATVLHAALMDNGADPTDRPDELQALIFVSHDTFADDQPQPRSPSSQLKVTMTRANGKWLITDLRPL